MHALTLLRLAFDPQGSRCHNRCFPDTFFACNVPHSAEDSSVRTDIDNGVEIRITDLGVAAEVLVRGKSVLFLVLLAECVHLASTQDSLER